LAWFREAKVAEWATPSDIKRNYASASFLAERIVIFNIGGNKYRLEVQVLFEQQVVYVRFVGTHQEYDERNQRGR
jgi:mRNA interferase HigB